MSWTDLIAAADRIRTAVAASDPRVAGLPVVGIGWATVEAERAILELDGALEAGEPAAVAADVRSLWTELDRDPALGARVWRRNVAPAPDRPMLVVLEPDTEGRVAASLARFGEGVAVVYLGDGPAGPGRLVPSSKPWGPHVVLV